jgi:hypothetical protein
MQLSQTLIISSVLISINFSSGCRKEKLPETSVPTNSKLEIIKLLPSELNENSGIIWYDNYIWTLNDGGGSNYIYAIDTSTGKIMRRILLENTINTDWEEIAQDDSFIYIGDFGNNNGSRQDLKIYRINKAQINDSVVTPEIISYYYSDQSDFTSRPLDNPFDCEAMIIEADTIYLFMKDWTSDYTRIYALPAIPGNYAAIPRQKLKVNGLVTASAYSSDKRILYLLGYKDYIPFVSILDEFIPYKQFRGIIRQISFTNNFGYQTEGIALAGKNEIIVSSEKGKTIAALYKVIFDK